MSAIAGIGKWFRYAGACAIELFLKSSSRADDQYVRICLQQQRQENNVVQNALLVLFSNLSRACSCSCLLLRYPAQVAFAGMIPSRAADPGQDYSGVHLVPRRASFVWPAQDATIAKPLEEGAHGRVQTFDLDELSAAVLQQVHDPQRVVTIPLAWALSACENDVDRIVILGAHKELEKQETTAATVDAPDRCKGSKRASPAPPAAATTNDMLQDLLSFRASSGAPNEQGQQSKDAAEDAFFGVIEDMDEVTSKILKDLIAEGDAMVEEAQLAVELEHEAQDVDFEVEELDDAYLPSRKVAPPSSSTTGQPSSSASTPSDPGPSHMVCKDVSQESLWRLAERVGLLEHMEGTGLVFKSKEGQRMGKLWFIGDLSVKVECSIHAKCSPKCSLFVDVARGGVLIRPATDVLKKMLEWLALGGSE